MTPNEIDNLFYFDPAAPRMIGYATNPSIVREDGAIAVSMAVQLLDRENKQRSGKWLWLQVQPEDALALVAAILAQAKEEHWAIPPNLLDTVERIRLSDKSGKH